MTAVELAEIACIWEATARKVGNVHPLANYINSRYIDFLHSAVVLRSALAHSGQKPIGQQILAAVRATRQHVHHNTNLGIILLLVPLVAAQRSGSIRDNIHTVLDSLTVEDSTSVYEAIRLASPAGLGRVENNDVMDVPLLPLREIMTSAMSYDLVARQYANFYSDILDFGIDHIVSTFNITRSVEAAIVQCHLRYLAHYPDSLIVRKTGSAVAELVRERAAQVLDAGGIMTVTGRAAGRHFDAYLRSQGNRLNPGTSADLVTACLYVALCENKLTLQNAFHWEVEDWL